VDPEDEEAAIEINAAQMEFMKVFREIRAFWSQIFQFYTLYL
jgi:hypothetical protein